MDPSKEFGRGGLNRFVDAGSLTDRIGLDDEEIAWRKEFIGFDEADEARLTDLEPLLRENQQAIADAFYAALSETVEQLAEAADAAAAEAETVAGASEQQAASASHVAESVEKLDVHPIAAGQKRPYERD